MVRIHPDPPSLSVVAALDRRERPGAHGLNAGMTGGISSAGRAPALQAGGRRFDPVILHQSSMRRVLCLTGTERFALAIEPVRAV